MTGQQSSQPNSYDSWYQQGLAQSEAGQHEAAVFSFEQALEYDATAYDAWYSRGYSFLQLERGKEAYDCYQQATNIRPDDYIAWLGYAKAAGLLNRFSQAIGFYERALALQEDETRDKAVTLFTLSALYPLDGRSQEGLVAHQQSVEIARRLNLPPDDPLHSVASTDASFFEEPFPTLAARMDQTGWGKWMGFAMKGKLQFALVITGLALLAIASLLLAPIGLTAMLISRLRRNQ